MRLWLHFPADEFSLVQLSIIDILSSKSPPSILFLDKLWETYKTPFGTVFKKWNTARSKYKIERELKAFEEEYSSHPFATPGSLEYKKLIYLDKLIHSWMENNVTQANSRGTVRPFPLIFEDFS